MRLEQQRLGAEQVEDGDGVLSNLIGEKHNFPPSPLFNEIRRVHF